MFNVDLFVVAAAVVVVVVVVKLLLQTHILKPLHFDLPSTSAKQYKFSSKLKVTTNGQQ